MSAVDLCVFALPMHPRRIQILHARYTPMKTVNERRESCFFLRAFFNEKFGFLCGLPCVSRK